MIVPEPGERQTGVFLNAEYVDTIAVRCLNKPGQPTVFLTENPGPGSITVVNGVRLQAHTYSVLRCPECHLLHTAVMLKVVPREV